MRGSSCLGDNLHDPFPDESVITHSAPVEDLTVTVPVGGAPRNLGETLTDRRSACSCP